MCGATAGGPSTAGLDLTKAAVVQGIVLRGGEPVAGAYVRLIDSGGDFVAEVPTSATGQFRFFAGSGSWTLRTLAPGTAPVDREVLAEIGSVADLSVAV